MTTARAITHFARLARENASKARESRRRLGDMDPMVNYYEGRAGAYLTAARILKGAWSAKDRNQLRRAA